MSEIMTEEDFIKKLEQFGFQYKEPVVAGDKFYDKDCGNYKIRVEIWYNVVVYVGFLKNIEIFRTKQFNFSEKTISLLSNLLRGFDDKIDDENKYTITFDVEDMIKEAEFCGYKINEEQAKEIIDYLNRKADGVYETIQQYITGYCQNNKFEELKEDEE